MPLIPALRKQRQTDLCEFKASRVYRVNSWTGSKATQRNPVLKNTPKKEKKKERKEEKKEGRSQA